MAFLMKACFNGTIARKVLISFFYFFSQYREILRILSTFQVSNQFGPYRKYREAGRGRICPVLAILISKKPDFFLLMGILKETVGYFRMSSTGSKSQKETSLPGIKPGNTQYCIRADQNTGGTLTEFPMRTGISYEDCYT